MRWIKASERLPDNTNPPKQILVKWQDPLLVLRSRWMTKHQLLDEMKWGEGRPDYEWLDEQPSSDKTYSEQDLLDTWKAGKVCGLSGHLSDTQCKEEFFLKRFGIEIK